MVASQKQDGKRLGRKPPLKSPRHFRARSRADLAKPLVSALCLQSRKPEATSMSDQDDWEFASPKDAPRRRSAPRWSIY
jgi:hypothetical protein